MDRDLEWSGSLGGMTSLPVSFLADSFRRVFISGSRTCCLIFQPYYPFLLVALLTICAYFLIVRLAHWFIYHDSGYLIHPRYIEFAILSWRNNIHFGPHAKWSKQLIDFIYPLDILSNLPSAARCGILDAARIGEWAKKKKKKRPMSRNQITQKETCLVYGIGYCIVSQRCHVATMLSRAWTTHSLDRNTKNRVVSWRGIVRGEHGHLLSFLQWPRYAIKR